MAENLFGSVPNISDSLLVGKKVKERLKGKKYLLLLDDVWNTTLDWEPLRCALQAIGGTKGTCILTTSRTKNAVEKMETYWYDRMTIQKPFIYHLKGLNEEESQTLFEKRVGHEHLAAKEKQLIGERMMLRCGGVPLAIRALGDMLRNNSLEKWKEIEKSEIWEVEDNYGIMPSLKLSFHYLPDMYLKSCFSYCAIFNKGEKIGKDNLIQLWMAQGFLLPYGEMEATGNRYFDVLLDSSLFQDAELDILGNVKTFKIHDLVLSLARVVSGGECLTLVEKSNVDETSEARHLSTIHNSSELDLRPEFFKKLRTWFYLVRVSPLDPRFSESCLVHCQQLRSLCLQWLDLHDLPEAVSRLKHLRYLDLSGNMFETLPIVITKLYHLQTLRIEDNYGGIKFPIPSKAMTELINLRYIICSVTGIGVPEGLGKMTALRSLHPINMENNCGGSVSELGSLNNLSGLLEISSLHLMTVEEARNLHFGSKPSIERLVLKWKKHGNLENLIENDSQNEILEAMKPHENLAQLEIKYYGGTRFPRWLTTSLAGYLHNNIVSLKLYFCTYAKGDLKLENFTSLRFLALICCIDLTISFPSHGFKCCKFLEELKVTDCDAVKYLPDVSPLTHLGKLEILNDRKNAIQVVGWTNLLNLREVSTNASILTNLGANTSVYHSLQRLLLNGRNMKILPVQIHRFKALKHLEISFFIYVERLPDWLENLTSLCSLVLKSLLKLKSLPSKRAMQCLSKLEFIEIKDCPLLVKELRKRSDEWFKIAYVPYIEM